MATAEQIMELRLLIDEPENKPPYTDELLGHLIDTYGVDDSRKRIWISKRDRAAKLVDISEGGSSRKMSQYFDHLKDIVGDDGEDETPANRAPRTREITR